MGEVYRARDSRLGREVAIKVLPEEVARDPERLARFQREARALAALNHPHVATLLGIEQHEGKDLLVMELVLGETLADRIAHGPIAVEEAIPIFLQIAEGLEAAHEKGIIHRDLKPANIKLGADGASVKILDFGLAKAMTRDDSAPAEALGAGALTQSPTLTLQATRRGEILGTAQYMSPEQARGLLVDRRTDIWAFGACLYEALTGRPAFDGEDVSSILAAVIRDEPDLELLPAMTPLAVRSLVRRCLGRRPKERLHDIGDAAIELRETLESRGKTDSYRVASEGEAPVATARRFPWRSVTAVIAAAGIAGVVAWNSKPDRAVAHTAVRSVISSTDHGPYAGMLGSGSKVAVSRDGGMVAWLGPSGVPWSIYLRRLDELEAKSLDGTDGAMYPAFSPGGDWIAFAHGRRLEKISTVGGVSVPIDVDVPADVLGLAWGDDDHFYFGTRTGLYRVAATGGDPELLAEPDPEKGETGVGLPDVLPGGRTVLATHWRTEGPGRSEIVAIDVATRRSKIVIPQGGHPHFIAPGYLVYAAGDGSLEAVAFDPQALEVRSEPITVAEEVVTEVTSAGFSRVAAFAATPTGSLAYVTGASSKRESLVWLDRTGRTLKRSAQDRSFRYPRLSPDGGRLATVRIVTEGDNQDIWVLNLADDAWHHLTFEEEVENYPVWTSDGRYVFYASGRLGETRLVRRAADGTGAVEAVVDELDVWPTSLSPDGRSLAYRVGGRAVFDLRVLDLATGKSSPLVEGAGDQLNGEISPDGRWLAYQSNERVGRHEVYVRPFPNVGEGHWQVSTDGGREPRWSSDGRELFYRSGDRMMAAHVESDTAFRTGSPFELFRGRYLYGVGRSYDVAADGTFVMVESAAGEDVARVVLIQNLDAELKRRLSAE